MQPAKKNQAGAQEAITDYQVLETGPDGKTLIELYPRTGRTHQIRVHLQSIGCPIIGDWLYGDNKERPQSFERLLLHAYKIEIPIYEDEKAIIAISDTSFAAPFF